MCVCADLCYCSFVTSAHFFLWSLSAACDSRQASCRYVCLRHGAVTVQCTATDGTHANHLHVCCKHNTNRHTVSCTVNNLCNCFYGILKSVMWWRLLCYSNTNLLLYEPINLNNTKEKNSSLQYLNEENYSYFSYFSNTDKQPTSITESPKWLQNKHIWRVHLFLMSPRNIPFWCHLRPLRLCFSI